VAALAGSPGAQSVLAAGVGPFGPLGYVPVPMTSVPPMSPPGQPAPPAAAAAPAPPAQQPAFISNAFGSAAPASASRQPQQPAFTANAFGSAAPAQPASPAPAAQGAPAVSNAFGPPPSGQTSAVAPGVGNSFTAAAPAQPVGHVMYLASPAGPQGPGMSMAQGPGGLPQGAAPVGYVSLLPGAAGLPAAHQSAFGAQSTITTVGASSPADGLPLSPPTGALASGDRQSSQDMLLGMMREALFPSHREWAAETLAAGSDASPQVIDALVQSARQDPAASMRATCIRCLVKIKADTAQVREALAVLQTDPSPLVKQEADAALGRLGAHR